MKFTFEDIWNTAENKNKLSLFNENINSIIEEIKLKLEMYNNLNNLDISPEELNKLKTISFGEILFSLSKISLLDNINVAAGLHYKNNS